MLGLLRKDLRQEFGVWHLGFLGLASLLFILPTHVVNATGGCECPLNIIEWNVPQSGEEVPTNAKIHLWGSLYFEVEYLFQHDGDDAFIIVPFEVQRVDSGLSHSHLILTPTEPFESDSTYEVLLEIRGDSHGTPDLIFSTGAAALDEAPKDTEWEVTLPVSTCYDWDGVMVRTSDYGDNMGTLMIKAELEDSRGARTYYLPPCKYGSCSSAGAYLGRQTEHEDWPNDSTCVGSDPQAEEGEEVSAVFTLVNLAGTEGAASTPIVFTYESAKSMGGLVNCGGGWAAVQSCGDDDDRPTPGEPTVVPVLMVFLFLRRRR